MKRWWKSISGVMGVLSITRISTISFELTKLEKQLAVRCEWHFFERGWGKGPCDGVGGTVKQGEARATRMGQTITTAQEFFTWASNALNTIKPLFIEKVDITEAKQNLQEQWTSAKLKTVPQTQGMHQQPRHPKSGEALQNWWGWLSCPQNFWWTKCQQTCGRVIQREWRATWWQPAQQSIWCRAILWQAIWSQSSQYQHSKSI